MKTFTVLRVMFACVIIYEVSATVEQEEEKFEIQRGYTNRAGDCTTENKRYHIVTSTKMNWSEALKDCQRQNRRLATVTCKEENDKIIQLIEQSVSERNNQISFWTAGTDIDREGQWSWKSTEKPIEGYTYWHVGEPNNLFGNENCLYYYSSKESYSIEDYKWNDAPCNLKRFFICEDL